MTALKTTSVEPRLNAPSLLTGARLSAEPFALVQPPAGRRLTKKSEPTPAISRQANEGPSEMHPIFEKLNQDEMVIKGRRLRCKLCRRELAGRDHILFHSLGRGQQAFAPHKQDMVQLRLDQVSPERCAKATHISPRPAALANLRIAIPPQQVLKPQCVVGSHDNSASPSLSSTTHSSASLAHLSIHSPPLSTSIDCSSYFVEPLSWMRNTLQTGQLHGKLACPNSHCNAKLGSFDWAGSQCSCGAWITPGFQILRSKVDEV